MPACRSCCRCRINTARCPCEPAFSKQISLAFATTDLCSQPAPSTPMRVPHGRSLSEPSRHTCLMTLDESPLMPMLERLRWRQGWRAARQSTCAREASGQMVSKARVQRKAISDERGPRTSREERLSAQEASGSPRPTSADGPPPVGN